MTAEEAGDDMRAVRIAYDHRNSGLWGQSSRRVCRTMEWLNGLLTLEESGYAGVPITMKSDQEPAMMKLKRAVAVRRKAETALIKSPVREFHANGRIERAVRKWLAQFTTMRHYLESKLGAKIDNNSALVEWLIVWTADILSKYTVHENGCTFYEMSAQHVVEHKVIGFAEKVHFQF